MKYKTLRISHVLLLIFSLGIVLLWVLGTTRWQAPVAQQPDAGLFAGVDASMPYQSTVDFPEQVARPVFVHGRQPKPSELAPAPVQSAPLADVAILGLFNDGQQGGVLLRVGDGKVQRLHVGEALNGWKLERVEGRQASFMGAAGERTVLEIKRRKPGELPPIQSRSEFLENSVGAMPR
jgi:hypothetical protein